MSGSVASGALRATGARGRLAPGRWAMPFASLLAWSYVSVLVALAGWVLLTSLVAGWRPVMVEGGSMAPGLRPGDILMVETAPASELGAGNVVVVEDGTGLTTHRVLAVQPDGRLVTAGDANAAADADPVEPAQVRGVGRLVVPLVGLPLRWLAEGAVWRFGAWLLATVLVVGAAAGPLRPRSARGVA